MTSKFEVAVFGGGCFWCTEAIFKRVKGVEKVIPGYAGGSDPSPSYEEVSTSSTGHAEVISVEFDPKVISFNQLLEIFFHTHNPTTKDQQGADVGNQYRSLILTTNNEQLEQAEKYIKKLVTSKEFKAPIVTEVKPLERFFPAEGYHHDYYTNNPHSPYCQLVIEPKIKKFLEQYPTQAKSS